MTGPHVYRAISAVAADLAKAGIAKDRLNLDGGYFYRAIDEVLNRLGPLLPKRQLCILPRVLERAARQESGLGNSLLTRSVVKVAFDFISVRDGSIHTVESCGEALDESDKATAKALTGAYKAAVLQSFCVPVAGLEDADAKKLKPQKLHYDVPPQGWHQWVSEVIELVGVCESAEAVQRMQRANRGLLAGLRSEQPELYARLGDVFAGQANKVEPLGPDDGPTEIKDAAGAQETAEEQCLSQSRGRRAKTADTQPEEANA